MQDTWSEDGFRIFRRMLLLLHGEMSRDQTQLAWKRAGGGAGAESNMTHATHR